jgi:uncharacterized protein (DUF924 family)
MSDAEDILNYWFYEVGRDKWFANEEALDTQIRERFAPDYHKAVRGELRKWEETPEGMIALLLLLDEFPRRMFRGTPRAFETSEMAVELAREGIIKHFDDRINWQYKLLFYLPFLNSENIGDQHLALFYIRERVKDNEWLEKAEKNHEIIVRYGRFPQRDPILGRKPDLDESVFPEK